MNMVEDKCVRLKDSVFWYTKKSYILSMDPENPPERNDDFMLFILAMRDADIIPEFIEWLTEQRKHATPGTVEYCALSVLIDFCGDL